jgi:hypothetical protein
MAERTQAARRIVTLARFLATLARRPELCQHDRADRIARALPQDAPGPLPLLDAAGVAGAGELDQLCAAAVRILGRKGGTVAPLLDLLGYLPPERVAAIYWALPADRRRVFDRDPACSYQVAQYRDLLPAAQAELDTLIEQTTATETDVTYALAREMLPYGEPHAL